MGDEFIVTDTASVPVDPAIAALSNGRFVVVWAAQDADQRGMFGQVMTPAGVKFGRTAFRVNQKQVRAQERPSVAAIRGEPTPPNNGGFIVVWDARDKNLRLDVQGRRFGPNGKVLGDEFAINTVRSGYQYSGKIATLNDGSTVVIWVSNSKIRGQQFTPAGAAVGPEFNVSRSSTGDQDTPKITARADGGFIAVWSASGDGDGTGIFGQRFDANGAKLLPEFLANTGPGSQIFPAIAASPDSDAFVTAWSGVFARVRAK